VYAEYVKVSADTTQSCCERSNYDMHVEHFRSQGWVLGRVDFDTRCLLYRFEWFRGDRPATPLKTIGERECSYCGSITKEERCGGCGAREMDDVS
jgi:hypothetical protein